MRAFFAIVSGLVVLVVVAVVAVVGLSMAGAPSPSCADGTIAVSKAAEDSFNAKWAAFDAAVRQGGSATVTFSEEEVTSRGASYLTAADVPAKNLQVHLCRARAGDRPRRR